MTSQEYTQWLKGFLDAVDGYNITKKQFDMIREKLKEVDDTIIGTPIGNGGWGTPNYIGGGWTTISSPAILPLSGTSTGTTLTTSSYPSGSTITYTTNGSGVYTLTGNTTTTSAYVNQSGDDGDEKLLKD
jgi:hypothetical protein